MVRRVNKCSCWFVCLNRKILRSVKSASPTKRNFGNGRISWFVSQVRGAMKSFSTYRNMDEPDPCLCPHCLWQSPFQLYARKINGRTTYEAFPQSSMERLLLKAHTVLSGTFSQVTDMLSVLNLKDLEKILLSALLNTLSKSWMTEPSPIKLAQISREGLGYWS